MDDGKKQDSKSIKMGTKHKESGINYCKWCGAPTAMEQLQMANTPILEFIEEKIDKLGRNRVWSSGANWSELDLDSDDEAELLVYDEMLNTIELKHVCEQCVLTDNELWKKYYSEEDDDIRFDADF
tara:strand:+ start:1028 stop:1405 length:378 start_codon:yes stop_codon:yes gene_type:complete